MEEAVPRETVNTRNGGGVEMSDFWQAIGQGVGSGIGGVAAGAIGSAFGLGSSGDRSGQARRLGEYAQRMALQEVHANELRNLGLQKQVNRYGKEFQWLVNDARKAGLHPLFALGGSANISPISTSGAGVPTIAGQSATGSVAKDALVRGMSSAGSAAGKMLMTRAFQSTVARNEAEAIKLLSDAELSAAKARTVGGSPFAGMSASRIVKEVNPQPERLITITPGGKTEVGRAATPVREIEDREGEIEAFLQGASHTYHKRVQPKIEATGSALHKLLRSVKGWLRSHGYRERKRHWSGVLYGPK